jgi:type IV pilus assembly protein PilF
LAENYAARNITSMKPYAIFLSICFVMAFTACATVDTEKTKQAENHNKMGTSFMSEGKYNEAYAEFQKAIMLDPKNKESLNQLGYLSAQFKKYDDAISYYRRAIASDPDYTDAMNNLGVLYLELENWDEAIKCFNSALKNPLYRSPEKPLSSMGYAYFRKGEYSKAETYLKEALARNPIFSIAYYTLGLVYVKDGDDNSAIGQFQKAIDLMPDYMDAHWEIANAYRRLNIRGKALKHYKIVAEKDTDIKRSREALRYIELLD